MVVRELILFVGISFELFASSALIGKKYTGMAYILNMRTYFRPRQKTMANNLFCFSYHSHLD